MKELKQQLANKSRQLSELKKLESTTRASKDKLNALLLNAKDKEVGEIKAPHADLTGKLGDLQSAHERCSRKIDSLEVNLAEANKTREAVESNLTREHQSFRKWVVAFRGIADRLGDLMIKMKMDPLDLPADPLQESPENLTLFFENVIAQLKDYHAVRIQRLVEEGKQIAEAVSRCILARIHYHNPLLNLKVIFKALPSEDDTEQAEGAVAKHVEKIDHDLCCSSIHKMASIGGKKTTTTVPNNMVQLMADAELKQLTYYLRK